jgi:hypothetical protein
MDIDCDGVQRAECRTDPSNLVRTSFSTSTGQFFDAVQTPYFVVPLPSNRFNYQQKDILPGAVGAVIFNNQVVYAVFADEGPADIIGEASYATAQALGINPDPASGGTNGPVTFIVFQGTGAVVKVPEDHSQAVSLGQFLAAKLLRDNN